MASALWMKRWAAVVAVMLAWGMAGCESGSARNCGDGECALGDTCFNCPEDCGACVGDICGDGMCGTGEFCDSCRADCGACADCGDGLCAPAEQCSACPEDCGACDDVCGDQICSQGESCITCAPDCGQCVPICGDQICSTGETCGMCPADCGPCSAGCGDGVCAANEDCASCTADCGPCGAVCGDGSCDASEDCASCAADCGTCGAVCGDGSCDGGEDCVSCAADCGACPPFCGDGVCEGNETVSNCLDDCYDWPAAWAAKEQEILDQVNAFRSQSRSCGFQTFPAAPALTMNAELRLAARLHAQDMADQNYFAHGSLDGRDFMDRINDAGYTGSCPCGENIAAGNAQSTDTMDQWITSVGHCENMMGSSYHQIGIGYGYNGNSQYDHYWVQNFGN